MQIKANSFLALIVFLCASTSLVAQQKDISKLIEARVRIKDGPRSFNTHGVTYNHGKAPQANSRESNFTSTLIDSSRNGYGAYIKTVNPLAYVVDVGYLAVYRQWVSVLTTHGIIGASQSEDGEEWDSFQKLNMEYPGGVLEYVQPDPDQEPESVLPTYNGQPQGRYPSAGFVAGGYPTPIWNEYTDTSNTINIGGGSSGGYPLYNMNLAMNYFPEDYNSPANYTSNNGCTPYPCDPADLWAGNATVIPEGNSYKFIGVYSSWDYEGEADRPYQTYIITSAVAIPGGGGYFMHDAKLWTDDAEMTASGMGDTLWAGIGYISDPRYDINADGHGYMVQMGYPNLSDYDVNNDYVDSISYKSMAIFFKKTEDYGDSWTDAGGFKNSGYHVIPESVGLRLTDSLYTVWTEEDNEYYYHYGDTIWDVQTDGTEIPYLMAPGWDLVYTFDMQTDADGGLHIVFPSARYICPDVNGGCDDVDGDGWADSLYWEETYGGSGIWHIYSPDPMSGEDNWTASFIFDMALDYEADWFASDIATLYHSGATDTNGVSIDFYGTMQYFYPNITMNAESEDVMWFAIAGMSDYEEETDGTIIPLDVDLYMAKSTDNGHHWSEVENVTNTPTTGELVPPDNFGVGGGYPSEAALESGIHLANQGMDESVGVFYQMMDPNVWDLADIDGYEDFKNWVYVGVYENDWEYVGTGVGIDKEITPKDFTLKQNYPNPFNPITQIQYEMKSAGQVNMELFDIRGAKVRTLINENKPEGSYKFAFDGSQLSSGVYFYSMTANGFTKTRKLVLMK